MSRPRRVGLDLAGCTDCGACLEVCPGVFGRDAGGLIMVRPAEGPIAADLIDCVAEALALCPGDCISWED